MPPSPRPLTSGLETKSSLQYDNNSGRYLEAEPETGVRQQVDAALHHVLGDAEVGGELGFHVGAVQIFSVLALGGRRHLCRDHMDGHRQTD